MKYQESLFKSLFTLDTQFGNLKDLEEWLIDMNNRIEVKIETVNFHELDKWSFDSIGNLVHDSGRFFSIEGLTLSSSVTDDYTWDQPIINQPEIGYLGILAKEFDGVLYFLMQAKIEPGNVNNVQLSPTLQATKSNYSKVHEGNAPAYLEYFQEVGLSNVIFDQLQSEQGSRFLRKRNRNMIIHTSKNVEVLKGYRWVTLGQIKKLMLKPNMVNMDTRSILSSIIFTDEYLLREFDSNLLSGIGRSFLLSSFIGRDEKSLEQIRFILSSLKSKWNITAKSIPLSKVKSWIVKDDSISHVSQKYFDIIGVKVTISNREVNSWHQPIVRPKEHGLCAFFVQKQFGVLHFLVQVKYECGNHDMFELAPSLQCSSSKLAANTFLTNEFHEAKREDIILDVLQSEEGGRFYHEQNRNMIISLKTDKNLSLPENYVWMTLGQLNSFIQFNNFVNIQARSILSQLQYS